MDWTTLSCRADGPVLRVTLRRPDRQNAVDATLIAELGKALDLAEQDGGCRLVVLDAEGTTFCAGMDMREAARGKAADALGDPAAELGGAAFFALLRRFTTTPRALVATVDGRVSGGGVGLVAACDFVHTTGRGGFGLPEALWGLLPCSVLPFLIRRTGHQRAATMTLSTLPLTAQQALACGLADELSDDAGQFVRRLAGRLARLDGTVIGDAKRYLGSLAPIGEQQGERAVAEFARLMSRPEVRSGIEEFARSGRYPWER
ncbi:enoyl-CoA hydratase-related protein [Saccharothrix sp. ST-888]|uniref:enoyl-CoA hydratase-related protein n=1 Tax=Saccharothrix sp. ST-888 TaxID=1427391 RepID=UPI0005EC8808|nr:enoyl-CoA hydratase-related protein [Saccharothrix sp. ST-888]KJK59191.1 hypothetical protein UK12_05770 [Saccharothrix sp. ST-888]